MHYLILRYYLDGERLQFYRQFPLFYFYFFYFFFIILMLPVLIFKEDIRGLSGVL